MRISKEQAAAEQVEQAIRSLRDGRLAAAVTLAGAAEDVLPDPEDPERALFYLMRQMGAQRGVSEKEVVRRINYVRNWLKHHDAGGPEIDLQEEDAVMMILRACTKLDTATSTTREFEQWFRQRYRGWVGSTG